MTKSKLSPKAEALRKKLRSIAIESAGTTTGMIHGKMLPGPKKLGGAQITEIIHIIVEELGITDRCDCGSGNRPCSQCNKRVAACSTLLELAKDPT